MRRAAVSLAFASAASVLFSIAASQILLALALVALLLSGEKLRVTPAWLPLALFLAWTLVSLAASPDPAAGLPQVRKMFVFTMLLACFSLLRDLTIIRRLCYAWFAGGALVAARGLAQFFAKWSEARALGRNFYEYYVGDRITGFMSHWMTFGGLEMTVLLLLAAFLFFAPRRRGLLFWLLCLTVMAAALALGFTRGIWLAALAAMAYLLWHWRRWTLVLVPVALGVTLMIAPGSVRSRLTSLFQPRGAVDSNQHRVVTFRTGVEMVKAHPLLGLGPEMVGKQFLSYVPADIPRPLPTGWYGHLHNIYLHYAAERGLPATGFLVWFLLQLLYDFTRALRRLPPEPDDRRFVLRGAVAVVIATMVGGLFELNLGDSEVLMLFLAVVSCGYVAALPSEEAARA